MMGVRIEPRAPASFIARRKAIGERTTRIVPGWLFHAAAVTPQATCCPDHGLHALHDGIADRA